MTSHLNEGVLVRFLDAEVSEIERMQVSTHVQQCSECARELGAIETRSRSLVALLERADPTPRVFALTRRQVPLPARRWPVAAAVVLALGAAALAATPVRAWILERWADLRRAVGVSPSTPLLQPPATPFDSAGRVSFLPVSDVLLLHVATRQAEGHLILEGTDLPRVSAEMSAAGTGAGGELVVLPGELRIVNATSSRASYRVALPTRLNQVVVSIDGEAPIVIAPVLAGERRTIVVSTQTRIP